MYFGLYVYGTTESRFPSIDCHLTSTFSNFVIYISFDFSLIVPFLFPLNISERI